MEHGRTDESVVSKECTAMNILLTSAGRRTYLINYFKDVLRGDGLVHASNSILTYSLLQADKYVITPTIYDTSYIDFLLAYCHEYEISAIISLFDIDLPILAKNRERFAKEGITLVVSNYEVTQICNDKWKTYNFLLSLGLRQTKSYITLNDAKAALNEGTIHYPLFIKPRWGMGSIGIWQVENEEELDVLYKKLHRDLFNTYLKYESNADVDRSIIIQEKIDGKEYGLDLLNDLHGEYVTTIAKQKLAMRAGETDVAKIVDPAPFVGIGKTISKALRHIANLDIDCFVTSDGDIYVLEMNCRFGGQYPFSHLAGVNFPEQIIKWLKGEDTDFSLLAPKIGVVSCKDLMPVVFKQA